MSVKLGQALRATAARAVGDLPDELDISIDSRSIAPGQTYLALRGENFDGHAFAGDAFARGAAAAIVEHEVAGPSLIVADGHAALLALASLARENFCGASIAITGSTGKTTTKDFLAQIIRESGFGRVTATPANENNEIGVSKLMLSLGSEAAVVVEAGARHYGDIAPLVAIARPHVAILTNIGEAHLDIFGSRERLADTKWQIFSTGAQAVISLADVESRKRASSLAPPPIYFGLDDELDVAERAIVIRSATVAAHDSIDGIQPDADAKSYSVYLYEGGEVAARAPLASVPPGEHNLRNLAAAIAAAVSIGINFARAVRAAVEVALPKRRYERRLTTVGAVIIDDAYNASPSGTIATLRAFAQEPGRRIIVLSSMAEIGDDAAPAEHRRVGKQVVDASPDLVYFGGAYADDLAAGAADAGLLTERVCIFRTNAQAIDQLRTELQSGDVVLVKGSRMYRLEEIVEAFAAQAT